MINLDAFGKQCPLPVIMVKQEIESKDYKKEDIVIRVDNEVAIKNIQKLINNYNAAMRYEEIEGGFEITITVDKNSEILKTEIDLNDFITETQEIAYFITSDKVGTGSDELGGNLMNMITYAMQQMATMPSVICMMNSGVRLATVNEETIKNLKDLEEKGVRILVCGACLQYYNLKDKLQVGEVSNAYEILSALQTAKVIRL